MLRINEEEKQGGIMIDALRELVFSNLNSAKEGGYFECGEYLDKATPEEVADDMVALASDLEDYRAEDIISYVREWLKENVI
jgi:hypothetical protein